MLGIGCYCGILNTVADSWAVSPLELSEYTSGCQQISSLYSSVGPCIVAFAGCWIHTRWQLSSYPLAYGLSIGALLYSWVLSCKIGLENLLLWGTLLCSGSPQVDRLWLKCSAFPSVWSCESTQCHCRVV